MKNSENLVGKYVIVKDDDSPERDGQKGLVVGTDPEDSPLTTFSLVFVNFDMDNLDLPVNTWIEKDSPIWPYAPSEIVKVVDA